MVTIKRAAPFQVDAKLSKIESTSSAPSKSCFLSAEKKSMQSAGLAGYRFRCFVEQLEADFNWDNFSYSTAGRESWKAVYDSVYAFFEKANFKPVPMADGTMKEIHFADQQPARRTKPGGGRKGKAG